MNEAREYDIKHFSDQNILAWYVSQQIQLCSVFAKLMLGRMSADQLLWQG